MQVKLDTGAVSAAIAEKLKSIKDLKPFLRIVAFDVLDMMTVRIHEKGLDATNKRIGTYNSAYLKTRVKKYKRSADQKIISSLTRQQENDWAVGETPNGWGIGFNNPFNADKAKWLEEKTGKKIFSQLSPDELEYAQTKLNKLIEESLK